MNSLIFRTAAPLIVIVMLIFSVFILLRGHNDPGGGFIGGLIAAAAIAVYGMAMGVEAVRLAMQVRPLAFAGFGILLAAAAGLGSLGIQAPFLTGQWLFLNLGDTAVALSTPQLFDVGVYFVVFGTVTAVLLALEAGEDDADE